MPHAGRTKRHVVPLQEHLCRLRFGPHLIAAPSPPCSPSRAPQLNYRATLSLRLAKRKSRWRLCGRRAEHGVCPARSQAPSHGMRLHPTSPGPVSEPCLPSQQPVRERVAQHSILSNPPHPILSTAPSTSYPTLQSYPALHILSQPITHRCSGVAVGRGPARVLGGARAARRLRAARRRRIDLAG